MPARSARDPKQAATVAPTAFAPQKSGATEKELVLFELERARVAVKAAIQGLGGAGASRPVAPGRWSPREIVLHLAASDRMRLDELGAITRGTPASWVQLGVAAMADLSREQLAPLHEQSWDDAVRQLDRTRCELLAALQAVPAEPAGAWSETHPLGSVVRALAPHDREHAQQIKDARIAG